MTDTSQPLVSVIVIFNRGQTEPCLNSLLTQSYPSFEIVGVVNKITAACVPDPRIRWIEEPDPNPARRRNIAAAAAKGDILAFIDDDAAAPLDWLSRGVAFMNAHPEAAGMGGPNLLFPDAPHGEWLTDVILTAPFIGSGNPTYQRKGDERPARPGDLHLCNMFIRRSVFQNVHGFNEALGYGAEDSEFMYVAGRDHGAAFRFAPDVFVHHHRRPFRVGYLAQRFRFRRQNGRLMWVYPRMYAKNRSLAWGAAALVVALLLIIHAPGIIFALALLYLIIILSLTFKRTREKPASILIIPFLFVLHHCAYALGLLTGLAEGIPDLGRGLRGKLQRKISSIPNNS